MVLLYLYSIIFVFSLGLFLGKEWDVLKAGARYSRNEDANLTLLWLGLFLILCQAILWPLITVISIIDLHQRIIKARQARA